MKIFELRARANDFQNLVLADAKKYRVLELFDGTPRGRTWKPLAVRMMHLERPSSDFPSLATDVPVFSARAAKALEEWLLLSGELLPLLCDAGEYYAYNVTTRLPALDQKKSELTRFETGEIMMIDKPVFIRKIVADATIFKLTEKDISPVYVTDAGKRKIERAKVTGCRFREVWSDA